jgi:hypothetical protein
LRCDFDRCESVRDTYFSLNVDSCLPCTVYKANYATEWLAPLNRRAHLALIIEQTKRGRWSDG